MSRFLLTNTLGIPASPGANRNALLLHTIGQQFLSCDDDSVCYAADFRHGDQSVAVAPACNIADYTFYAPSRREARRSVPRLSGDFIAVHEALLGRCLGELPLAMWDPGNRRVGTEARVVSDLIAGKGHVPVTISGVLGDSGLPHAASMMLSAGEARARLLHTWNARDGWDASRHVVLRVSRPTLSLRGPLATTTATGFDNRDQLPPFTPSGRGEDTLFGAMLPKCSPHSYIGYVPVGLMHEPDGFRRYGPLPITPLLVELLENLAFCSPETLASSPADRLKSLGRHFIDCGTTTAQDFNAHLLRFATRARVEFLKFCERQLELYRRQPVEWAQPLEQWMIRLERALLEDRAALPVDMVPPTSPEDTSARVQRYLRQFGRAIVCWPDITAAARELSADGHRVGARL